MRKTAFVCLGSDGYDNSFVYQEVPRREDGEEFFVFVSPGDPAHGPALRRLFRAAISDSRLGAPASFLSRFVERLEKTAEDTPVDELMAGTLLVVMIRRGGEVHLLRSRDCVALHRDGETSTEGPISSIGAVGVISLRDEREQGDLFTTVPEDLFVLERFRLPPGSHALVFVPSNDFLERNRRALADTIFFPSFEVPESRSVDIGAERTFPAICWEIRAGNSDRERTTRRFPAIPLPAVAGVAAAIAVVILIFGPWSRNDGTKPEPTPVLLSAEETPTVANTGGSTAAPAEDAEGDRDAGEANASDAGVATDAVSSTPDLAVSWKKKFPAPVTSTPVFDVDRVYFGCRDGYLYAYNPNGTFAWKYGSGDGIGATPIRYRNRVIGANYAGTVFCLDAGTGEPVWTAAAGAKIVSRPAARGDLVIVGTMAGRISALRLEDGAEEWSHTIGAGIWAGITGDGDAVVAATTDGSLVKIGVDGKIRWETKPGGGIRSTPLCIETAGLVVFGTETGFVYGYATDTGELMWRYGAGHPVNGSPSAAGEAIVVGADGGVIALDMHGRLLWKRAVGGAVKSTPEVNGNVVYVTTYGSQLVALDVETGDIVDEYRTESPLYSSPVIGGDRVFFGSMGGFLHAVSLYGDG